MAEKRNIFLVGPMGAGKSTIGRELADRLHLDFFDSDQEIERRTGADIAWVFDLEGEEGFRLREESVIEDLTEKQKKELLALTSKHKNDITFAATQKKRKTITGPVEIVLNEKKYWKEMGKVMNKAALPYLRKWKF